MNFPRQVVTWCQMLLLSTALFAVSRAEAQASVNLRILPLGDSITAGYRSSTGNGYRGPLAAALNGQVATVDFVGTQLDGSMPDPDNEGHFGYQIDRLAALTDIALYRYRPNVVLLDAGINDLGNNNDVSNAPARLGSLIDQVLEAEPEASVLVAQLVVNSNAATESAVVGFNNQLALVVQERASIGKHVVLVDMSALTTADLSDGLHPNDNGYQLMANAWDASLQQIIAKNWITEPLANSASLPTGAIYSGMPGKCLGNVNGSTAASNPVDVETCNVTNIAGQQWNVNSGAVAINGLCLDIVGALTASGTLVDVWHCNQAPNQIWVAKDGMLVNPASDRCLSVPTGGSQTQPGLQLDIEDCAGTPNQQWTLPFSGTIASGRKDFCLNSAAGSAAQGNQVLVNECDGSPAQRWMYVNQALVFDGKCLNIDSATARGNLIDLAACAGGANQAWTLSGDALVNPVTNKCLEDQGGSRAGGLRLNLSTCSGAKNQQFTLIATTLTTPPAPQDQAAAAFAAWNDAFLIQETGTTYYATEERTVGSEEALKYTAALDIAVAEDAYQHDHSQNQRNLIISLLDTFLSDFGNGTVWTDAGDNIGYNDDIAWMTNAVLRGYQLTGKPAYLTAAENNWNAAYNRGWNPALGGGIEEASHPGDNVADREALSNDPFVFTGVTLHQLTGDVTYLNKAESIYAWVRTNLFNSTAQPSALGAPGQINQGLKDSDNSLLPSDHAYNGGSFVTAAAALYRVTGNMQYYNDAVLAIDHRMAVTPILHDTAECCGNQWAYWFTFGVSQFATEANLWPKYLRYLQENASVAWSARNALNLTWNDWTSSTDNAVVSENPDAVEMESAVAIWQHLPPAVPALSGNYEIHSVASGLPIGAAGMTRNGNPIVQSSLLEGSSNATWTFTPTSGGYFRIRNVNSGEVISVKGASARNGAPIVQSLGGKLIPGNDQWLPALNPDGSYSFYNFNSLQALDVPNGTSTNGAQLDQWFGNSTPAQKFYAYTETVEPRQTGVHLALSR